MVLRIILSKIKSKIIGHSLLNVQALKDNLSSDPQSAFNQVEAALKNNPKKIAYQEIKANALIQLGRFHEAFDTFKDILNVKPNHQGASKQLVKLKSDLKITEPLPRNLYIIVQEADQAYQAKDWKKFDQLVDELGALDSTFQQYWLNKKADVLMQFADPVEQWKKFHDTCPLEKHSISFKVFINFYNALLKEGDIDHILEQLPNFKIIYNAHCPINYVPRTCSILISERKYEYCLNFLDEIQKQLKDEKAVQKFESDTYQFRIVCEQELNRVKEKSGGISGSNPISTQILEKMLEHNDPATPVGKITEQCAFAWKSIAQSSDHLLLDIKFDAGQADSLKKMVKDALITKKPFSLINISGSDSYGFSEKMPEQYPSDLAADYEMRHWGKNIDVSTKKQISKDFVQALSNADAIGFPGSAYLVGNLDPTNRPAMSQLLVKFKTLVLGVQDLLSTNQISKNKWWADKNCNHTLVHEDFLLGLMEIATNVIVVSPFEIPYDHLLDHPKVKSVLLPKSDTTSEVLEQVLGEKLNEMNALIQQGTLVLVSAGFLGKHLADVAKAKGAVALDVGATLGYLLGHEASNHELMSAVSASNQNTQSTGASVRVLAAPVMEIKMEDINNSGRAPLFIKDRQRLASSTSVKIVDPNHLICCNFVGRKIYLVHFDPKTGKYHTVDSADTVYGGVTTETDLCDADEFGNIVTSNFYLGTFTLYKREGDRISFIRDLPFNVGGFVHGVRFYTPEIIAVTVTKGKTGVYFFNLKTSELVLYVENPVKTQDVLFVSENRMIVISAHGAPKKSKQGMYHSTIEIVEFDLEKKTYHTVASTIYNHGHFDCTALYKGNLYLTDQYNNRVEVMNIHNLTVIQDIEGYSFPHGIDIKYDTMAVTNYGSNKIFIQNM
ncbi:MAG: hypothetical protein IT286_01870 [Proteobacteria bacterium]|nr:hypothetical protein [Pseudomonadota bacterium]